jgi:Flp pilus assembly pilin Flp
MEYILVLALVAVMLVIGVRYGMRYFGGTFRAWGDKHYDEMSQGKDHDRE